MRLAEDLKDFWTDADLNRIIDWCHRKAVLEVRPWNYLYEYSINSVFGQEEYGSLPSDIMVPLGVTYATTVMESGGVYTASTTTKPKSLDPMSLWMMNHHYAEEDLSGNEPEHWAMKYGGTLGTLIIRPAADKTITNGIKLLYIQRPADFTNDSQSARAQEIEDIIGALGAYRCWLMQGGQFMERANQAAAEANTLIGQARQTIGIPLDFYSGVPWEYRAGSRVRR